MTKWLNNYGEYSTINVTLHISRIFHMNEWIALPRLCNLDSV